MSDDRRERVATAHEQRAERERIIAALRESTVADDDFYEDTADAVLAALGEPQEAGEMEWIVEVRDPDIGGWREGSQRVSRERAEEIARLWRPGVSGLRVRIVPLLRGTPVEVGNEPEPDNDEGDNGRA